MTNPNQCANILGEKQILSDSLISQKELTSSYNAYAGECASTQLRSAMLDILNEEHGIQASIFNSMQSRGWYTVEPADRQKIVSTRQKLSSQ